MVDAPTDPPSKAILARQAAWAFAACSLAIGSFLEISKCNHFVHRELSELVLAAVLEALAVFSLMRSVAAARGPFGFLATICSLLVVAGVLASLVIPALGILLRR